MTVNDDEWIELQARAIIIRSYAQILIQPPVDRGHTSTILTDYIQKLHDQVLALEPLVAHIGELRDVLHAPVAPECAVEGQGIEP